MQLASQCVNVSLQAKTFMRKIICRLGACFLDKLPKALKVQTGEGKMKFGSGGFNPQTADYLIPLIKSQQPQKTKRKTKPRQSGKGKSKKSTSVNIKACGAGRRSRSSKPKPKPKAPKKKAPKKKKSATKKK